MSDEKAHNGASLLDRITRARHANSRWLMVAAIVLFVAFTYLALRALPPIEQPIRWELLAAVGLIVVPLITLLNALEFRLIARLANHHPAMLEIMQVTILAAAANLLPVPGAVVVRLANLKRAGVRVTHGLNLTAIVGLTWLGTAGVLGGLFQVVANTAFAVVAMSIGGVLLGIALTMLVRALDRGERLRAAIELLVIETTFNLASALRLFLVAAALHLDVSYAQSVTLVIALVAAAAIGFLPSGLGVREALAALLSPIIGLPASVGLVITAVDRVVSLIVLAALCRHRRVVAGADHVDDNDIDSAAPTTTKAHLSE